MWRGRKISPNTSAQPYQWIISRMTRCDSDMSSACTNYSVCVKYTNLRHLRFCEQTAIHKKKKKKNLFQNMKHMKELCSEVRQLRDTWPFSTTEHPVPHLSVLLPWKKERRFLCRNNFLNCVWRQLFIARAGCSTKFFSCASSLPPVSQGWEKEMLQFISSLWSYIKECVWIDGPVHS